MVMAPYLSDLRLNLLAINCQEIKTPRSSPATTQYPEYPAMAPIPVSPISNQPDSPVALAENATAQKPMFFPPT